MRGGLSAQVREAVAPPLTVVSRPIDWIMPPAEVDAWLARAPVGARLIYGQGGHMVQGMTQQMLRARADAGDVHLFQPRSKEREGFDFLVVKRAAQPAPPPPLAVHADPAMRAIYQRLKLAAKRGERCPTNADLAVMFGLTVDQVAWRIKKLVQAGRIQTRVVPTLTSPQFRVVTIMSTGRETAAPAHNRLRAGPPL